MRPSLYGTRVARYLDPLREASFSPLRSSILSSPAFRPGRHYSEVKTRKDARGAAAVVCAYTGRVFADASDVFACCSGIQMMHRILLATVSYKRASISPPRAYRNAIVFNASFCLIFMPPLLPFHLGRTVPTTRWRLAVVVAD